MTERSRPRPSLGRWLAVAGSVIAFSLLTLFFWIRTVAERRASIMHLQLRELQAGVRSLDEHPPRPSGGTPGNSWEDYGLAFAAIGTIKNPHKLQLVLQEFPDADRATAEAEVSARPEVAEHLHRAASRAECDLPQDASGAEREYYAYNHLTAFSILSARLLAREGHVRKSAEVLLDLCHFGRDVADCSPWTMYHNGLQSLGLAIQELRVSLLSKTLTREDLEQADVRLCDLDERFPRRTRILLHQAIVGGEFLEEWPRKESWRDVLSHWRFGFSGRIVVADAFDRYRRALIRCAELDPSDWLAAQSEIHRLRTELLHAPSCQGTNLWDLSFGSEERLLRTRLRLLRSAVGFRLRGHFPEFRDPLGATLLHDESPDRARVWSVGVDGVDDRGTGSWADRKSKDIVLEIER